MGRVKGEAGHGWTVDWFLSYLVDRLDFLIVSLRDSLGSLFVPYNH